MTSLNVCNRLYTLGKRRQELKEFNVKKKFAELEERELEECNFKPNLCLTDQKNGKLLKDRKDVAGYEHLMTWKKMKDTKLTLNTNTATPACSHTPAINKTSKIIMSRTQAEVNRNLGRDEDAPFNRHEQLYYDALQRKKKQEEVLAN